MGRSVHINEGIVFVVIIVATILEGILGALLVVPLIASLVVVVGYLRRRVLGLAPFEDDGMKQFAAPPEKINPPKRVPIRIGRSQRRNKPASDLSKTDSKPLTESQLKKNPDQKEKRK